MGLRCLFLTAGSGKVRLDRDGREVQSRRTSPRSHSGGPNCGTFHHLSVMSDEIARWDTPGLFFDLPGFFHDSPLLPSRPQHHPQPSLIP